MSSFSPEEIKTLEELHLVIHHDVDQPSYKSEDLLKQEVAVPFLENVAARIEAPDTKVAASLFMKRYAFLAVIYLYGMSAWNKQLDVSFENVELIDDTSNPLWIPGFRLSSLEVKEGPAADREHWRKEAVEHLFKEHLYPMLGCFGNASRLSNHILWENIIVYIFWLYETLLPETGDAEIKERAAEDFRFIMEEAEGRLFGPYNQNPLKRYNSQPVLLEEFDKYVRIRKTCCFNYRLKAKKVFCGTCPLYCKQYI